MKKERRCPCGSKLFFSECCLNPKEGMVGPELKIKIEKTILETFEYLGETRGELCLYVSMLVKDLLDTNNIHSYIVGGRARWIDYPHFFDWKPNEQYPEFHVWVVTEYGELVDLACDAFNSRHDAYESIGPMSGVTPPSRCWGVNLHDRTYEPIDYGCKNIKPDNKGYIKVRALAYKIYSSL